VFVGDLFLPGVGGRSGRVSQMRGGVDVWQVLILIFF
jgi:hypothetical protein